MRREGDGQSAGEDAKRRRAQAKKGLRLFVAAYPPAGLVDLLRERLRAIELPPHRMTPADQVHLTLHFIGDTPEQELERVLESVERATAGLAPALLTAQRLIVLPKRGPARLVAVETDAPGCLPELHSRLVRRLAREPRTKPGGRYLPHLTLCRFRSPSRLILAAEVTDLSRVEDPDRLRFPLNEVMVMRSVLKPDGAQHHRVASFRL